MCQSTDLRLCLFPERSFQTILESNKNHSKQNSCLNENGLDSSLFSFLEPHLHKAILRLINIKEISTETYIITYIVHQINYKLC